MRTKVLLQNLEGKDHSLRRIREDNIVFYENVDWIHLVLRRDRWRALTSMGINLRVS
jgi:hypothetical protein